MTPELVERLVTEVEDAIGEPVRHTIRKLFPERLDRTIADEVALAWKAPKRVLMLSNQLSRLTRVTITATRFPRETGSKYPAEYGVFSFEIMNAAPNALDLLSRLPAFATLSGAFMSRADSPDWAESMATVSKERALAPWSLRRGFRFVSEEGWSISERFGWGTYIGPRCALAFGPLRAPEIVERTANGGALIWLTKEPFDFRNEDHFRRYAELTTELAAHLHPGNELDEI
jgi:hypothetical protein